MAGTWRRAQRRRTWTRVRRGVFVAAGVAVVVVVVASGIAQVGRQSGSYDRTVADGYGALMTVAARQSQATDSALAALLTGAPSMTRDGFFAASDRVTADAGSTATQAVAASTPPPPSPGAAACTAALSGRAAGVAGMVSALQGLLGDNAGASTVGASSVLSQLESSETALSAADTEWAACRRALRRGPGRPLVPSSSWVTGAAPWNGASLASLVAAMSRAPSLAARHGITIAVVTTSPAALTAGGTEEVPPTSSLTVHVVVDDSGNVDEPAVQVRATLVPAAGGTSPAPLSAIVAVRSGRAVAVVLGPFAVTAGSGYRLDVTALPPSGSGGATTATPLQITSLPPTTTTTSTTAPTTTTTAGRRG